MTNPNEQADLLFRMPGKAFSCRAAGVLLYNGAMLLQSDVRYPDDGYALPGGHIRFGETAAETLMREYAEETGAAIAAGNLLWTEENFYQWGNDPWHQICLTFAVTLTDESSIPLAGDFPGKESHLRFRWAPLEQLPKLKTYPNHLAEHIAKTGNSAQHIVRDDWTRT